MKTGEKAPDFSVKDDSGKTVKLSDFKGKKVVLYFYPKDDTPGCTREACSFRDEHSALQKAGAVVLGVSPDSGPIHAPHRRVGQGGPGVAQGEGRRARGPGARGNSRDLNGPAGESAPVRRH